MLTDKYVYVYNDSLNGKHVVILANEYKDYRLLSERDFMLSVKVMEYAKSN